MEPVGGLDHLGIDVDKFGQCCLSLRETGRPLRCQIHVLGCARTGHPSEHAHPVLEQPLGLLALGEDT